MGQTAAAAAPGTAGWLQRTRESRLGNLMVLAVTAVIVSVAAYGIGHHSSGTAAAGVTSVTLTGASTGSPPVVGRPAQDFTATTTAGSPLALKGLRGHPVWLTFGASWCAACRAEAPDVEAAAERAKASGAVVVEVFLSEDAATVRSYAQRVGLTYQTVADPDTTIASAYRVLGIPSHFFIDGQGILRSIRTGSLDPQAMDDELRAVEK
jgi:cytochrome c biogenesis protein CcmG, thiol:disulfide interchange protein DsbE